MMSFQALVADDEYMIRRGIISFLNKSDDFEVVAEAEDGEMALELAMQHEIDVFFVDINMPFVNGFQFIEKLREFAPEALVVIITGYDSFDYARDALRLGAFEYLLKPLMEDVFEEMLQRVRERLINTDEQHKYLDWAKGMLEQNRDNLIAGFWQNLLAGRFTEAEITEQASYLGLTLPQRYTLTLIRLEYRRSFDVRDEWNDDLIYFVARNIAGEIFGDLENRNSCQDDYGNLVMIHPEIPREQLEGMLHESCRVLEHYAPVKCMGCSRNGVGYQELSEVYQEASAEVEQINGESGIIKEVKKCIEANYFAEDFSLQDAADSVNLSEQYLSKIFRKEMGITFIDYLTTVRIRKAVELFQDSELKVYEIAEKVGYSTQHYFSNVFKKKLGVSPAEYRKMLIEHK